MGPSVDQKMTKFPTLAWPYMPGPQMDWSDHDLALIRLTYRFLAPAGLALTDLLGRTSPGHSPGHAWHDQTRACSWFWPGQAWIVTVDFRHG